MNMKPGWQTTEFWAPILTLLVTALVTLHYVPAADAPTVTGYLSALVVGLAGVVGNVLLVLHYVRSRTTQKEMILAHEIQQSQLAECTGMGCYAPPKAADPRSDPCPAPAGQAAPPPPPPNPK